jgi:peptidoglycan/LPS O-acetylase OafA/YrhL
VNYFLLGTFILVLLAGIRQRFSGSEWLLGKPMPLWSYATFTANIPMGFRDAPGAHWVGITWSLAVEEQFYLLFPLVVFLLPRRYLGWFTVATLPIALLLRVVAMAKYGFYAGYMWGPCRMDALMLGVIVAQLLRNDTAIAFLQRHRRGAYGLLLALALLLQFDAVHKVLVFPDQYSVIALGYAILILISVLDGDSPLARMFKSRFLIFTGLISYALYMFHQAVNGTLHMSVFHDEPRMNGWARFAVTCISVVIAFLISYASQVILERPVRNWGRQFKYRPKPLPTAHPTDPGPTAEPRSGEDKDEPDKAPVLR